MGVHGLWQLIESASRPITLESLENKILAIDVSIWLNQAVKGYRDVDGRPLHNAHLLGLFQRISKLLYYKIKPVFVFDGGVPQLKKQTLAARKRRREIAAEESAKAGKQIISNYLRSHVIGSQLNNRTGDEKIESLNDKSLVEAISPKKRRRVVEDDLYKLPSMNDESQTRDSDDDDDVDEWEQLQQYRDAVMVDEYQDINEINVSSDDFKDLPAEVRYDLLKDMKETRRNRSMSMKTEMPEVAEDFSDFQLKKLMKRRVLQKEIETVEKEMIGNSSAHAMIDISSVDPNNDMSICVVSEARRIASDDVSHVLLINKKSPEKPTKIVNKEESEKVVRIIGHRKEIMNRANEDVSGWDESIESMDVLTDPDDDGCLVKEVFPSISVDTRSQMSESSDSEPESLSKSKRENVLENDHVNKCRYIDEGQKVPSVDIKEKIIPDTNDSGNVSSKNCETDSNCYSSSSIPIPADDVDPKTTKYIFTKSESDASSECETDPSFAVHDDANNLKDVDISSDDDDSEDFVEVRDHQPSTSSDIGIIVKDDELTAEEEDSDKSVIEMVEEIAPVTQYTKRELMDMKEKADTENLALLEERGRQDRRAATVTSTMAEECQELLRLFGVPFVVSPMEAEAQCAELDVLELTHGTITDDSDVWLFGGRHVYKNVFNQKKHVEVFHERDIISLLGIDREMMIKIALLTGSDYTEGIDGVGPVTAMEILAEFPGDGLQSLRNFKEWSVASKKRKTVPGNKIRSKLKMLDLHSGFPCQSVYRAYLEPEVDRSKESFSWSSPDLDELRHFARLKFGWPKTKADEILLPVLKKMNSGRSQLTLDRFLNFPLAKEKKLLPSKRLQRVLNKMNNKPPEQNEACSKKGAASKKSRTNSTVSSNKAKCKRNSNDTDIKSVEAADGLNKAKSLISTRRKGIDRNSKSRAKIKMADEHYLSDDSGSE